MKYRNIARIGLFRDEADQTISIAELQQRYFTPNGTNIYIGFKELCDRVNGGGQALLESHTHPMKDVADLAVGDKAYASINIEPDHPTSSDIEQTLGRTPTPLEIAKAQLEFVIAEENQAVLPALAQAIAALPFVQDGSLIPITRFAGEMNSGNSYAGAPNEFKNCLPSLKAAFSGHNLPLSFCPAINSGINSLASILQYWPDDDTVFDFATCTFYARPQAKFHRVFQLIHDYFASLGGAKRLMIDELSGCADMTSGNDSAIHQMLDTLSDVGDIEYVTLFLSFALNRDGTIKTPWGSDATLNFLKAPVPAVIP